MKNSPVSLGVLVLMGAGVLVGQTPAAWPQFDAATVKVNRNGGANGFFPSPGRLRATNSTLEQLIQAAYHVGAGALIGAGGWMETERYDIEGQTRGPATFDEEMLMLRGLLEDRFRLRFHGETRQMTTLALARPKGGLKLEPARVPGQKEKATIRRGEISGTNIGFGHFVSILQAQLSLPIANETGLSGEFDFALTYDPGDAADASGGPSVFAAVEEQLGLKLERRKSPVEVMVIDRAEKPAASEN